MTITGWIAYIFIVFIICCCAVKAYFCAEKPSVKAGIVVIAFLLAFGSYAAFNWYFTETASGRRAVVDETSNLNNGLERTINILNADGEVIRTYTGVIDIEGNDGGYVLFELNGKRYMYYNCYVESIADIKN